MHILETEDFKFIFLHHIIETSMQNYFLETCVAYIK